MSDNALENMRTRWRRWLGNKTRRGYPYWTTLLETDWIAWAEKVHADKNLDWEFIGFAAGREKVKRVFAAAINFADMDALRRLDGIYCEKRWLNPRRG